MLVPNSWEYILEVGIRNAMVSFLTSRTMGWGYIKEELLFTGLLVADLRMISFKTETSDHIGNIYLVSLFLLFRSLGIYHHLW